MSFYELSSNHCKNIMLCFVLSTIFQSFWVLTSTKQWDKVSCSSSQHCTPGEDRTRNLVIYSLTLSQLSYRCSLKTNLVCFLKIISIHKTLLNYIILCIIDFLTDLIKPPFYYISTGLMRSVSHGDVSMMHSGGRVCFLSFIFNFVAVSDNSLSL